MPSAALERARDQIGKLRSANAMVRRNATGKGKAFLMGGSILGGSALAGALNAKVPDGIMGVEAPLIVGPGLIVGGLFGLKGTAGMATMLAGFSVLGSFVDRWVEDQLNGDT